MKYLMLICGTDQIWTSLPAGELADLIADVGTFSDRLGESGELVDSQGLISRPRAVRATREGLVVTDGPRPGKSGLCPFGMSRR